MLGEVGRTNPADCRQQRELRGYWEFCTDLPAFPPAVVKKGQAGGEVPFSPLLSACAWNSTIHPPVLLSSVLQMAAGVGRGLGAC